MPEPTFGQIFHTQDGKTVFIDPKTKQATVFDGIKTLEQILEPVADAAVPGGLLDAFTALSLLTGAGPKFLPIKMDFLVVQKGAEPSQTKVDPLGPKEHYVLVKPSLVPLEMGAARVRAWASEYKNGHKPDYPGYEKHRILPEQFEWLQSHKDCVVLIWYDQECPAFACLACQDHAKIVKPIMASNKSAESKMEGFSMSISESDVAGQQESVTAEEREI